MDMRVGDDAGLEPLVAFSIPIPKEQIVAARAVRAQ
jgi:hypothetical protein